MPSDLRQPGAWATLSLPVAGDPATSEAKYLTGRARPVLSIQPAALQSLQHIYIASSPVFHWSSAERPSAKDAKMAIGQFNNCLGKPSACVFLPVAVSLPIVGMKGIPDVQSPLARMQ